MSDPSIDSALLAVLRLFDGDGDHRLDGRELERVLANLAGAIGAEAADRLRQRLRGDGSGLPVEEVLACARDHAGFCLGRNLRELFALIDADGSGDLGAGEIDLLLQALGAGQDAVTLLARHDRDGGGSLSHDEFIDLLESTPELALSLVDIKRLKKTLLQYTSAARTPRIALVEVDCDLGAGISGAGDGVALLRRAAERQLALRRLGDRLIEEIEEQLPLPAGDGPAHEPGRVTPHARHIHTIAPVLDAAASLVAASRGRGLFPIVLAGDHSTAAGTIAGLRRAHPDRRLGVVWIDAHADIHSPFTTPSGNMHGMPLAIATGHDNLSRAINDPDAATRERWTWCQALSGGSPAIAMEDLIYVSVRATEAAEDATIAEHAIPVISTAQLRREGPEAAAARCLEHLAAADLIYVSFDVDSLDATICKGTGTPAPGGLWADEAVRLNRALLRDPRVCCWEICEINPHLDTLNSMAELSLGVYRAVLEVLEERLAPVV